MSKRASRRASTALETQFLSASTPVEQAQAYVRWFHEDIASWQQRQGMKYPVSRSTAEKGLRELLEEVADPSNPEHESALSFLSEAREKVLGASERARRERASALAEAKRERYESQGVEVDSYAPQSMGQLRGKKVWLYHGTASALLPEIRRHGIRPRGSHGKYSNVGRSAFHLSSDRVFLTARPSGQASAEFYARAAARKHGGDPVVLRVLVDGDALTRDRDDSDIGAGRYQFEVDAVEPGEIKEILRVI